MASNRFSLGSHFLSSKKKEDLNELFNSFDKDHDGKISASELDDMLHSAGLSKVPVSGKVSPHLDSIKEELDFEDFANLMRPTLSDPTRTTTKQQELKEAFDAFDKDNDGFINSHELQAMMEQLGDKISVKEAEQLIHDVDLDKDGQVNFPEFAVMMGVSVPKSKGAVQMKRSECPHSHHRLSLRRFFCSHK
ncbi:hypothetical protein BDB01DRAFT_713704 [Pilobolus umbonatus]|nr:hypothetical protein BDB01DRAFT_713704 [Pilobolus umbonatus]